MSQTPAEHPAHLVKKCTIVKDRVGCVKTSTYNLPPSNHTYGMKTPDNTEGCGHSKLSRNIVLSTAFLTISPVSFSYFELGHI